jgi:L-ribulose-5-phosphate 3-epimerase
MNRRQFTKQTAMASAMASVAAIPGFSEMLIPPARNIKKGIMWGSLRVGKTIAEKFQAAKIAGFDGVEVNSHLDRNEVLKAMESTGLPVHSVCGAMHWKYLLTDPDPKVRESGIEALKVTLEDAKTFGSDTVLLVPGRVTETVAYDVCWKRSMEEIKKVIPLAEKYKVKIAIENVGNNFLFSPMEAADYVDQFRNPIIAFYFDCGNVLSYGWPEQWIRILGKRIAKVHIKDRLRKQGGESVKLREGDVDWPAVMAALDSIGYHSWTTIEHPGGNTPEGLKDLCDRLKLILES